ncbi:MAG: hypothetical protein PWP31_1222 [Clostridia bacterium]|nr:hypothetical protein [Clostridia bacterium]
MLQLHLAKVFIGLVHAGYLASSGIVYNFNFYEAFAKLKALV